MHKISELNQKIQRLSCDRELGWLQMRLLVLDLMNCLIPLTFSEHKLPVSFVRRMHSIYKEFLQVPFYDIADPVFCVSIRNEVVKEVNDMLRQLQDADA